MAKVMRFLPPWGPYYEVDDSIPPTGSAAPNQVGKPPAINFGGGDEEENVYKDEEGVFRNRRPETGQGRPQGGGGGYAPSAPPAGARYDRGGEDFSFGGGGGGGGSAPNYGSYTGVVGGRPAQPPPRGTMGGGGNNMAFSQSVGGGIRTQYSSLDPNAWGQDSTSTLQQVGTAAQGAVNAGDSLMGVNPQVGAADRTLYDRYQSLLLDPSSMMQDKNVGFMLDQAQEAARRQLAAGRMRHSGNALTELAQVTSGNLMGQFRNLADVYRNGADTEFGRWQGQTGAGLDAARIRAGALGSAAQAYTGAGQLGTQSAAASNDRARLDLERVTQGIASPQEEYRAAMAPRSVYVPAGGYNLSQAAALGLQGPYSAQSWASTPGLNTPYSSWVQSNWGY